MYVMIEWYFSFIRDNLPCLRATSNTIGGLSTPRFQRFVCYPSSSLLPLDLFEALQIFPFGRLKMYKTFIRCK